jgi:DNA repair protein RecO (recombination protein O)
MDWRDQGALLSVRPHGESAAIIEVFTENHGRHSGVVRGGASRRIAPLLQPGTQLDVSWRARLDDHIGTFTVEPIRARTAVMADRLALAGLNATCALLHFALPEREANFALYTRSIALFDALGQAPDWTLGYLHWELQLLEELGYGLDLTACAVTGSREDLAFVSPKSGRAVGRNAAGIWADRLLPLPLCLLGQGAATLAEITQGLITTGHFLSHRLAPDLGNRPLPEARQRFIDLLARQKS